MCFVFYLTGAKLSSKIGINYGQLGNNLPPPYKSIELIKSMNAGGVKLYDANPEILTLLKGTNLQVSIMVQNHEISILARNQTRADEWIQTNVLPYYPQTMIRFLLVGNEVLSYFSGENRQMWFDLVPAMNNIKASLKALNIKNIKVGTPLAMDALQSSFPPSTGAFRSDVSGSVILPMLQFLNRTKSFFFIDVYPYFPWSQNPNRINLDFALLNQNSNSNPNFKFTDPGTGLTYTNLLDQMLDSIVFAMAKLGFSEIPLLISETGWPTAGDVEQPGANIFNAATYNRNLIQKLTAKPPIGTPARPGIAIPTFLFALFDENQKTGPGIERHWGLLQPDGTLIYEIDLAGRRLEKGYKPLPAPENNAPYKGEVWCVAVKGASMAELWSAMSYACGEGNGTCEALVAGGECYEALSVSRRASYAFSAYWAKFRSEGASCYFNGLAQQTVRDPSKFFLFILILLGLVSLCSHVFV